MARSAEKRAGKPAPAPGALRATPLPVAGWLATRVLLLLMVYRVVAISPLDVTGDISVIYHGWYEVLRTGSFPKGDVTWQYPPLAALVMLLPGWLPFGYLTGFVVLAAVLDAAAMALLLVAAGRPRRSLAGAWFWVAAVPLLGPTGYARYDILVTAVAVAGLLTMARSPRAGGALAAVGALLKVWPVLTLIGTPRGSRTRRSRAAAGVTVLVVSAAFALACPDAYGFLGSQRDRGVEIESMGGLVFHLAQYLGYWHGMVRYHYGSVEFLGPYVHLVGQVSLLCTVLAFGWVLLWRLRARRWTAATPFDAALAAVLLFVVTSRVISPQYLVWLIGLAAVCLTVRETTQRPVAVLLLICTGLTVLEFPVLFWRIDAGDPAAVAVLAARNLLLLAAALLSCARLWRATVPRRTTAAGAENRPATVSGPRSPDPAGAEARR